MVQVTSFMTGKEHRDISGAAIKESSNGAKYNSVGEPTIGVCNDSDKGMPQNVW